ncbi:FATC domain protein [Dictyocaulus viviparus]|uniref:non-specific serine/threonine protein kinase n=1 Tax=Dictyocaulus viviparus TaxID=29172 RepID=A0A0D8Y6N6_DICVI|nr:FATC domain protein [Dictyocaulus viviparus]
MAFCGIKYSGNCRRLKYALAIRTSSWSDVSYPKKLRSHEECLFAILYTAGQSKKSTVELLKKVECESAVKDELPRLTFAEFLRDLAVFHTKYKITETEVLSMTDNRLLLFVVHCLRLNGNSNTSKNFDQQLVMISALINRLVTVEAFFPCLTLLENCPGDLTLVEKCRVLMLKGDLSTAEHILRYLLNMSTSCELEVKVKALCLLAELLADRRNMLDEAVSLLRRGIEHDNKFITSSEHRLHIFSLLHRLAARQLSAVEEHMESRAFRMRKDAIREWTRQRSIVSLSSQTKTARRIESELKCEKDLVESISLRLVTSALNTVVAGLETLKLLSQPYVVNKQQKRKTTNSEAYFSTHRHNISFRSIYCQEFQEYVASDLIPAVWLQVVNHVMVQCFSKNILASVIRAMVVKLIIAYPFHVLHTVLMYKYDENNAHIVDDILEEVKNRVTDKSNRARLCGIIEDMTSAHTAYIQFATLKTSDARYFRKTLKGKNVQYEMLESLSIMRMSFCLRRTPLPIVEQKVGFAGDYSGSDIVMWGAMESICTEANGLSAPKVLRTKGSDGKWYKLIWKNEDVRQDCLVEQLFSIVNGIMNHGNISSFLRTYKVVPLDSKCGIIEFCQGTISLKDLLCGMDLSGGLHVKAEPQDKKPLQIRCMLKDISKMRVDEATVIFRKACEQFQPVFRHYFYNNCRTIKLWLKMIDNYRCSLAQWSIVTYVVGIGDRHLSNILFETDTCKLVHIDLGMILEYSKRSLPIPERVPFRLTRDLLDPILIEGVSGGLLDEAVRVMRLMRENKEVILGFASVLLRETITNFEEVESSGVNCPSFVSETAIARLRDKLNGTDDSFGQQDVPHQVRRLFAEATNISNISRMFVGWMAFV